MSDPAAAITSELERFGINAHPVVVPTTWPVGPVVAYLFPDEPVTLIDSGLASGRQVVEDALTRAGRTVSDVEQIIVTHSHGDHIGGALWLQEASGCRVFLHRSEAEMLTNPRRNEIMRALLEPLGFDSARFESRPERANPDFTPLDGGEEFEVGGRVVRVEHHAGHTPGHLWITDTATGAIFSGDYLLASSPTNPGMMPDDAAPTGRVPMLLRYTEGLRELAARNPPVLFGGHGPPVTDAKALVQRRLSRIERRTKRIGDVLAREGDTTAGDLADTLYRGRARGNWDVMAELVGHLDVLVARGRATCGLGEDGYWHFRPAEN